MANSPWRSRRGSTSALEHLLRREPEARASGQLIGAVAHLDFFRALAIGRPLARAAGANRFRCVMHRRLTAGKQLQPPRRPDLLKGTSQRGAPA